MQHALVSSALVAAFVLIGAYVLTSSRSTATGGRHELPTSNRTVSPDAMHRTTDLNKLPVQQLEDMSFVFSSTHRQP
jgi:hypothetical protein